LLSRRKLLKIIILNFILYIIQVYCTLIYKYEQNEKILDVYLSFLFVCTVSLTLVSDPTSRRFIRWLLFQMFIYIYIYISLFSSAMVYNVIRLMLLGNLGQEVTLCSSLCFSISQNQRASSMVFSSSYQSIFAPCHV
jgi:hypothetical protein